MHIGTINDPRVPNVRWISVARKTGSAEGLYWSYPKIEQRILTGTTNTYQRINYLDAYDNEGEKTTHGQVGGASTPSNIVEWMLEEANSAGVKF